MRLDGRLRRTVPTVRSLGSLLGTVDPETVVSRVGPGRHRVSVVAVDRAGNRSLAATREFRVRP